MKLQLVAPRQGALWVRRGFAVFFKQPMAFAGLFAAFLFTVFLLMLLPFIGALVMLALLPLASLGFMLATRLAIEGRFPTPRSFIEPLRSSREQFIAIVKLGLIYAAATFLIMWLSDLVDGGALDALMENMQGGKTPPDQVAEQATAPRLLAGLMLRFGLAGLLSVPFWHAPALVYWDRQGWGKALFFSTIACWRNKGAFTVYMLTWSAVIVMFAVLTNLVLALFGQPDLVKIAAVPASLVLSTIFYASLYFTFADCFAPEAPVALPGPIEPPGPASA